MSGLRKGESIEALVVRLQGSNQELQWCYYGRNLGLATEEQYIVMVGIDSRFRVYEVGERYEVDNRMQGMRLIALGTTMRKPARAV
jgi:hypothetical protein